MFATSAGGQQSVFTSQLAECADEMQPGAFWRAYDVLYELGATGQYFSQDAGRIVADRSGVGSYSELLTCSRDADQINIDMEFGRQNGVEGTPAVMVRYNDGPAEWISYNGTTYNRGNVPYTVLAGVVEQFS
jgi:protein-disulfide isomerase